MNLNWYATLNKSHLTPPSWVFAPAWTFLYITIIISFLLLIKGGNLHSKILPITFFVIQMILNLIWSPLFFGKHLILASLIDIVLLWVFILLTIISFWQFSKTASLILIPYFLWVSFASYLNYKVFVLN